MSLPFIWPTILWTLLLVPLFAVAYRYALNRGLRHAVLFPDLAIVSEAAARARPFRRHLPVVIFLTGLAVVIAAVARPQAPMIVPADRSAIVLALDVSGSMRSQDVLPTRLAAAQEAAKTFIRTVPPSVRVGLVSFAGYATLLVPPGTDRQRLFDAIDGLYFIRRTAIGDGLIEAVAALPGRVRPGPDGTLPPVPPGTKPPGIVILLSDGRSNTGTDPHVAAAIARQQEVLVFTVGVGQPATPDGAWTIGGPLDEGELQAIANEAGGEYYRASSAQRLREVYRRLARSVGWERQTQEVTGLIAMLGGLVMIAAIIASKMLTHPVRI